MKIKFFQEMWDRIRGKKQALLHNEIQNSLNKISSLIETIIVQNNKMQEQRSCVGGSKWEIMSQQRMKNPLFLDSFGYKVFSQNDEDGIINEIFNRIGTTNKKFVEFGVQDGVECNSHLLLDTGWNGLWIDGNSVDCEKIQSYFKHSLENQKLTLLNKFINRDNINDLFSSAGFTGEIDFLSVDIDGMDWHILKAILSKQVISPRVICVEYNPLIPPSNDPNDFSTDYVLDYKEDWVWPVDDSQGASLSAYYHLCREFGYSLVGTCVNGVNAFFVKSSLAKDKFVSDADGALKFYNPWRHRSVKYLTPFAMGFCELNSDMAHRISVYKKNGLI